MGKIFGGTYKIVRKIGHGGMGSVFAAEKVTTHELFALKFMNRDLVSDDTYMERFKREIASLSAIRHSNVVNVFSWYLPPQDSDDLPYIVMELLEGEGLDELLDRKKKLGVDDTITIMLQVLDGLAAAHEIGVIHRDLGTTNVFLCSHPDGKFHVKLLDFGLAKPLQGGEKQANITKEGTVIGKAAFAAPEIFHRAKLDERSDIFSCGMMMMRMLTGKLPYKESSSHLLWVERYSDREGKEEYPPPRTFDPELPEALCALISCAIRKNPSERYTSIRDMQADLLNIEAQLHGGEKERTEEISTVDLEVSASAAELKELSTRGRAAAAGAWAGRSAEPSNYATSAVSQFDLLEKDTKGKKKIAVIVSAAGAVVIVALAVFGFIFLPPLFKGREPAGAGPAKTGAADAGKIAPPEAGPPKVADAEMVHIVVLGSPPGAVAKVGDVTLQGNPPEARITKGHQGILLMVSAKGYQTSSRTLTPDKDQVVNLTMTREAGKTKTEKSVKKKDKIIKGKMGTTIKTDYEE